MSMFIGTSEDWAWLAGFFDGEGSFSIKVVYRNLTIYHRKHIALP